MISNKTAFYINKINTRINPNTYYTKYNKFLINHPSIIFNKYDMKIIDSINICPDTLYKFNNIFNDKYKRCLKIKFSNRELNDEPKYNNQYDKIDHIDIDDDNICYILRNEMIQSSVVFDDDFHIYHEIVNHNNVIDNNCLKFNLSLFNI